MSDSHDIGAGGLDLIAHMTGAFARSQDIEETLRLGLADITVALGAEAASLFLLEDRALVCRACVGPVDVTGLRLPPGSGIVWKVVEENACRLVHDTSRDPDFTGRVDASTGFTTRSILCAPLSVRNECLGAIELFNKRGADGFDEGDRHLVETLAASAALALVNARMAAQLAEREALKRELALAADIQRGMLPPPADAGFPIHGLNLPARGVSGDFYDIVPLADGRIAFAIGDVSGKGMDAAMLMARTASLFRCLAKRILEPGRLLAAIDAELCETGNSGKFVTMLAGVFDPKARTAVLANAGHEPPLVVKDGEVTALDFGLPPLGIMPELFAAGCPERTVDLSGARLVLLTDGVTEAKDENGAMLGADGALALLANCSGPDGMMDFGLAFLARYPVPQDDATVVIIGGP